MVVFRAVSHLFKISHRISVNIMGIDHSPHKHPIPISTGIPVGIPIPTAALVVMFAE